MGCIEKAMQARMAEGKGRGPASDFVHGLGLLTARLTLLFALVATPFAALPSAAQEAAPTFAEPENAAGSPHSTTAAARVVAIVSIQPSQAAANGRVVVTIDPAPRPWNELSTAPEPVPTGREQFEIYFDGVPSEHGALAMHERYWIFNAIVPAGLDSRGPVVTVAGDLQSLEPYYGFRVAPRNLWEKLDDALPGDEAILMLILGAALLLVPAALFFFLRMRRAHLSHVELQTEVDKLRYSVGRQTQFEADRPDAVGPMPEGDLDVPDPPEDLIDACASGRCVLFAGSGVSAQAGLPTWTQFLHQFVSELEQREGEAAWNSVRAELQRGNNNVVIDLLLGSRNKREELTDAVVAAYGREVPVPQHLFELFERVPFFGAIAISPDSVVQRAARSRTRTIMTSLGNDDYPAILRQNRFFVLKLNGDTIDPGSLFVAFDQQIQAIEERPELKQFIGFLFSSYSMLFIGASPFSIEYFLRAFGIRGGASVKHFGLVPEETGSDVAAERFGSRYNLQLIPFKATPGYREVAAFLTRLTERVDERRQTTSTAPASLAPVRLERVALRNIGPFEKAEFIFKKNWAVLLGNNGSGKSTVLRAIALALCGDDPQAKAEAASLLRRSGKVVQNGSIKVTLGSLVYETTLGLDEQGRVIMTAFQTPPLKAGTLVTLGFPAIRGGSAGGWVEAGAAGSANRPQIRDVLPILSSGIDPRMDSLKQWIADTSANINDPNRSARERQIFKDMLDAFFEVVDDMIPGFELAFDSFNTVTRQVMVKTSDGVLPLDYLSQGIASTLGWVGVLLQRLYAIYVESPEPTKEQALLLIDEVDSHLHPEWQRLLVDKIRKHFPNLQVIATTHSPLMVGNLEEGEVIRIRRSPNGPEVDHLQVSYKGYRADQILTAEPFELDSTRDLAWEIKRREYGRLLGISKRSESEEQQFKALEKEIAKMPRAQETPVARLAADIVDTAVRERLSELTLTEEQKRALMEEAARFSSSLPSRG